MHVSNDICWLSQVVRWVLIGFFICICWVNSYVLSEMKGKPLGLWVRSFLFFCTLLTYPRHKRLSRTLNVTVHFSLGRKMSSGLPGPLCQFPCTRSSGERGGSLTLKKTVYYLAVSVRVWVAVLIKLTLVLLRFSCLKRVSISNIFRCDECNGKSQKCLSEVLKSGLFKELMHQTGEKF